MAEEIEAGARKDWVCDGPDCAPTTISLELLDFIKERIALTSTEDENYGRFVVRELVQNADDAKASILVLRFEPDALYVANDGRAFTPRSHGELGDFERISLILKRHQAEDKETTGHFGSGFQTVYALTNGPEVHSNARSGCMNPVQKTWAYFQRGGERRLVSPYVWKPDMKGVIFRFPWRDSRHAEELAPDGTRPFSNPNDWPRWTTKNQREMYEDLMNYVHQVLLCCNNLRCIRLVWAHESPEAYQAERNFTLAKIAPGMSVVTVTEGHGELPHAWYTWNVRADNQKAEEWRSFQIEGWRWRKSATRYDYLLSSSIVTDGQGRELFVGKKKDGQITIIHLPEQLEKILKRTDVQLLLPLFDARKGPGGGGNAFLYSTIPLPRKAGNMFAFNGQFFPEEGRKDVAVTSLGGKSGEWHRDIVRAVALLYIDSLERFVEEVQGLDIPEAEMQGVLLNGIPGLPPVEWMRPGKETGQRWADDLPGRIATRLQWLPILWTGSEWVKPGAAHWPRLADGVDPEGAEILRLIGQPSLTGDFVEHPHVRTFLREILTSRELTSAKLGELIQKFLAENGGKDGKVRLGQTLRTGGKLNGSAVSSLIDYCLIRPDAGNISRSAPIVPGEDSVLRPLAWYRIVPATYSALRTILPPELRIHTDFADRLAEVDSTSRVMNPDDIVRIIGKLAEADPKRFDRLSKKDHKALSETLGALVEDENFTLKPSFVGLRFVPFLEDGEAHLGAANATKGEDGTKEIFMDTRPENYERDFIYAPSSGKVPGLTDEVKRKIRFLDLPDVALKTAEKVVKKLFLKALQEGSVPTNFVRHFLSDRHGSLFNDDPLSKFLGLPKSSPKLRSEKLEFLQALHVYYHPDRLEGRKGRTELWLTPEDMGKVPCLYDSSGAWDRAGSFALEMRRDIEVLQYHALHPDLAKWRPETLTALGVAQRPEPRQIIEVATRLAKNPGENRRALVDIAALVLLSKEPWEDRLRELESIAWIPVCGGGTQTPNRTLLPTPSICEVLGGDFAELVDVNTCSKDLGASLRAALAGIDESDSSIGVRADELTIQIEPSLEVMLARVSELRRTGQAPPPRLFEKLNELIESSKQKPAGDGHYFRSGAWWDGRRILLANDQSLSRLMGPGYLILPPLEASRDLEYLGYIGAKESPGSVDLLQRITELCSAKRESVAEYALVRAAWDLLDRSATTSESEGLKPYRDLLLYPTADGLVAPSAIVFLGEERSSERQSLAGQCGDVYFLPLADSPHANSLRMLGARDEARLDDSEILKILTSLSVQSPGNVQFTTAQVAVRLLSMMATRGIARVPSEARVWPARLGETLSFARLGDLYVRDHPAARHFESAFPFLLDQVDGGVIAEVRQFALKHIGVRPFSRSLALEPLISTEREEDNDGTKRLRLMARALKAAFPSTYHQKPAAIDWLSVASLVKVDSLALKLTLEHVTRIVATPCHREPGDPVTFCRLGGHPDLYDELTYQIVRECGDRGLPELHAVPASGVSSAISGSAPGTDDFTWTVARLLSRDPQEWPRFIDDLVVPSEWIPPLMDADAEIKPGYFRVRTLLMTLYGYCQACGRRTPKTEFPGETCERVRSVVSMKGGRYKGDFAEYQLANSLFLCPSHFTLFERGLVRIPSLEDGAMRPQGRGEALMKSASSWPDDVRGLDIEIFEGDADDAEPSWQNVTLRLVPDHARALLTWLANWVSEV